MSSLITCLFCAFVELGAGIKQPYDTTEELYHIGRNPTSHIAFGVSTHFGNKGFVDIKYEHMSHWFDGTPFNNREEFHIGQIKIVGRYYFNK
jgi:hypothetical protein